MKCQGYAHKNPYVDNCGLCAPNWGWIPTPRPDGVVAAVRKHNSADYVGVGYGLPDGRP